MEGENFNKGYVAVNLGIDAFKSPIYLFPGIDIKLKMHQAKDEFFILSNGQKASFKFKKLNMRFSLLRANQTFIPQAKSVGLGKISPTFITLTQTKTRTHLCVREISSFTRANCKTVIIPH